ncbi:MAG: tetratricopeptide repeat protein [Candidatus Omnitrophica bacterium]|nr:tetratricopeptide repeat protein [Candidatus Omnitrophota bacterium]
MILKRIFVITLSLHFLTAMAFAQAQEPMQDASAQVSSEEFVRLAWEASSQGNLERLKELAEQCLKLYGEAAKAQQTQLVGFPERGKEKDYQALNDVATVLFIKAEALMNYGKTEEAIALFQQIIAEYSWSQAWDPRGWYWSVKDKSQASVDVMTGKVEEPDEGEAPVRLKTLPHLQTPGTQKIVDYTQFGDFSNVGTPEYKYHISNPRGLADAVGEGIYPNTAAVLKDPAYKKAQEEGRLEGSHWDFVRSDDLEAAFFKWATSSEPWGVKLFYIGMIFEKAQMYTEAIKAYHALVVHFPNAVAWTYWQTPWYPAQAAISKIKHIVRTHPELNLRAKWMKIQIRKGFDNDVRNDVVITFPGLIREKTAVDRVTERMGLDTKKVKLGKVKKQVGQGKVQLIKYENDHWQMFVDGKPFVIRGITYAPTKIGQSPDKGTLVSWMHQDSNNNGRIDGPYDSWVDKNKNNQQDADEPIVGDFQLMKDLGVNTLREYHQPFKPSKELLREMHQKYGFYVIMGDFLGKYTLGSGATWFEGTNYENPEHQKNMMESVRNMVMEFKDEPYILLWLLGNENNYGVASNADQKPEAYFKFLNEVAKMIKSIDPDHPVAVCNGDTLYLDLFGKFSPDVDIYAANVYRGDYGFGPFWEQIADAIGRPAFVSEYGAPAYAKHLTAEEQEEAQAAYHRGNWSDVEVNKAGNAEGAGNALGAVVFEWTDEWWKNYEPFNHDRKSDAIGPFAGGYYYEEWFGITSQGNGTHSPFLRQLRKSYELYRDEMWKPYREN